MFEELDLAELRDKKSSDALIKLRQAETEQAKLEVFEEAIDDIKEALSNVIISKVKDDLTIANLDQIQLYLKKELSAAVSPLITELRSLKSSVVDEGKLREKLDRDAMSAVSDNFDFMVVRKQKHDVNVLNFPKFPDATKVSNLSELASYFESLSQVIKDTFSVKVPTPKVTVNVPEQKEPNVNVDMQSVVSAIQDLQESLSKLKPQKTKYNSTDIVNALKELKTSLSKQQKTIYTTSSQTDIQSSFVNTRGTPVSQDVDLTVGYQIADRDDDTTTKYYGFMKKDGTHYILRETTSGGDFLYRYYNGGTDTNYSTAWTNRASKTYDYYNVVF